MPEYFQYTTGWPQPEIDAAVDALRRGALHPKDAKRRLARAVVDLYHGEGSGTAAEEQFDRLFKRHEAPPRDELPKFVLREPAPLAHVLAAAGLVPSNREGVRAIQQGGVQVDGVVAADGVTLDPSSLGADGVVVQVGRRRWALVVAPE
jgi:tyrosyl-tRNA synthetase